MSDAMTHPTDADVEAMALLPCPFCGGEAAGHFIGVATWIVICGECSNATARGSMKAVLAAWNRRDTMKARGDSDSG